MDQRRLVDRKEREVQHRMSPSARTAPAHKEPMNLR